MPTYLRPCIGEAKLKTRSIINKIFYFLVYFLIKKEKNVGDLRSSEIKLIILITVDSDQYERYSLDNCDIHPCIRLCSKESDSIPAST